MPGIKIKPIEKLRTTYLNATKLGTKRHSLSATSSWVGLQSATDREWSWEKTKFHRPRLSSRFACGDRYNVSWTTYLFSVSKETIRQGGATHLPEAPCHSLHVLLLLDHEDDSLTVSSSRRIRSQTTRNSTQSFCFLANSTHRLDTETQLSKGGIHPRTTNWKRASFFFGQSAPEQA